MLRALRVDRIVLAAAFVAWLTNALVLWLWGAPLGHDESQYAIDANDVLSGQPSRWFYLSKGMNALSIPGVLLGGSEVALRFVPFVLSLAFLVVTWQLARRTVGAAAAAWVVAVLAGSRAVVKWSGDLLSDMPSTTCLVAATLVIVDELAHDEGPRWRLVLAAPLFAAAFYLRYGSVLPIAIICLTAVALGWRQVARRVAPVIAMTVVFLVLLVPHFAQAIGLFGSPFGIVLEASSVPQEFTEYFGHGLVTYLTSNPFQLYGLLTPIVMLAALLALRPGADRRVVFLCVVGVLDIIALGLTTHARTRYIYFGITLLVIVGTHVLHAFVTSRSLPWRRILGASAAAATAITWVLVTRAMIRYQTERTDSVRGTLVAAAAIRADKARKPCHVLGLHYTQLEWYSGCSGARFSPAEAVARGEPVYVIRDYDPGWQPTFSEMPGRHHILVDQPRLVHVIRLDPPSP